MCWRFWPRKMGISGYQPEALSHLQVTPRNAGICQWPWAVASFPAVLGTHTNLLESLVFFLNKKYPNERALGQETLVRVCTCTRQRQIHPQGQLYHEGSVEGQQGYKTEHEGTSELKIQAHHGLSWKSGWKRKSHLRVKLHQKVTSCYITPFRTLYWESRYKIETRQEEQADLGNLTMKYPYTKWFFSKVQIPSESFDEALQSPQVRLTWKFRYTRKSHLDDQMKHGISSATHVHQGIWHSVLGPETSAFRVKVYQEVCIGISGRTASCGHCLLGTHWWAGCAK